MDDGSVCVHVPKFSIVLDPYSSLTAVTACCPVLRLLQCVCSSPCMIPNPLWFGSLHPEIGRAKAGMALSTAVDVLRL
jgi:hypothetical protein